MAGQPFGRQGQKFASHSVGMDQVYFPGDRNELRDHQSSQPIGGPSHLQVVRCHPGKHPEPASERHAHAMQHHAIDNASRLSGRKNGRTTQPIPAVVIPVPHDSYLVLSCQMAGHLIDMHLNPADRGEERGRCVQDPHGQ